MAMLSACPDSKKADKLRASGRTSYDLEYLFNPWLSKARNCDPGRGPMEAIDSLIYLWIPLNGWMAQFIDSKVADVADSTLVAATGQDAALSTRFDEFMSSDDDFRRLTLQFQSFWPIFDSRFLEKQSIAPYGIQEDDSEEGGVLDRPGYRARCFSKSMGKKPPFRPRCYLDHQSSPLAKTTGGDPAEVPLTWSHTIEAIYQVRCSVFHGGKALSYSPEVARLPWLSFEILDRVWGEMYFPRAVA